ITISRADRDRLFSLLDAIDSDSETVAALYQELDRATVVEAGDVPADVVRLNSQVRFVNEETGKASQVQLVLPQDHRPGERVAGLVPAGAALLGWRVGDEIAWPSGGKTLRLKLMEVG